MDKSKFNSKKEWQKFGYGLSVILLLIGTLQMIFGSGYLYIYLYTISSIILLSALAFPIVLKPLFIFFSYFGFGMNWLVTHLILTLVFYLLITPIGLLLKLFGKKLLDVEFPRKGKSYWISREGSSDNIENFKKQY